MENRKPVERKAVEEAMKGMKSFILYMLADFALIAGVVLVLFGIGEYISSALKVPGSGNVILGLLLCAIGAIVLSRSRARIQIGMQPPMAPQPPPEMQQPPPETPTGIYR